MCLGVCAYQFECPWRPEHHSPVELEFRVLVSPPFWVLTVELRSSARAVPIFNCWLQPPLFWHSEIGSCFVILSDPEFTVSPRLALNLWQSFLLSAVVTVIPLHPSRICFLTGMASDLPISSCIIIIYQLITLSLLNLSGQGWPETPPSA